MVLKGMRKIDCKSKTTWVISCIALFISFTLLISFYSAGFAAPKKVLTAKPGECTACHESEKVLPSDHVNTKDVNRDGCLACHQTAGNKSLKAKMPGSHAHALSGVTCEKCHGKAKKQEAVEMKQCTTCHNPSKLVEKTANVKPENPHTSPHYGANLDCNLCHHQHEKSENYCNQCHKFDFVVP